MDYVWLSLTNEQTFFTLKFEMYLIRDFMG